VDLESVAQQLYGGSPDDFVERRKALAAEARAAKDRALATAIGKLRRPTRSAWLVNLYAREAPEELAALLELGAALQAAQEQLSAPDLRRLSTERQKTLAAATQRAAALGEVHGYSATEAVRQEVTQTLQAALADPAVAEQVRTGTVVEAQAYGGFGVFGLAPAASPEPAPTTQEPQPTEPDEPEDESAQRRTEAEQRLNEAEAALAAAADEADRATEHADELADRVETLRAALSEAEGDESEARQQARTARRKAGDLTEAVRAAREAYEAL
jgi:hypothetical protein